jgi:hypothetical protein
MQKTLECKCPERTKNYINGSNVHEELEEDEVVKQQFWGGIDNINKRRGEGCCFQSSQQSNTLKNKFLIFKT